MIELKIDWDFDSSLSEKRKYKRMSEKDIIKLLYDTSKIDVVVFEGTENVEGRLIDLSAGGVCVLLTKTLTQEHIKIIFFLGNRRISAKGRVVRTETVGEGVKSSIAFIGIDGETLDFLKFLYASKVLNYGV